MIRFLCVSAVTGLKVKETNVEIKKERGYV